MDVKVASKLGQSVSQSLGGIGLAGGSMLLRLRRTSIALLALVGAVGLGLIAFISQLGWPTVLSGPLPSPPAKVKLEAGVALTQSQPASVGAGVAAAKNGGAAGNRARRGKSRVANPAGSGKSDLGGSRGLSAATGEQPGSGSGQPATQPQPAPVASPPSASIPTSAGNDSSSAAGKAKAANDGARSADLASSQSPGPKTAGNSPSSRSKSGELASVKAQHDESTATSSPPPAAASAPVSPAAVKEAADAAR